jgi:hypothetical protein
MLTCSRFREAAEHFDDVRRNCLEAAAPAADDRSCLIEPHGAGNTHPPVRQEDGAKLGDLELVGDASKQLADDVLERDQSEIRPSSSSTSA